MADTFTSASLDYWRSNPIAFIEQCLINPETGAPFELLPAERAIPRTRFHIRRPTASWSIANGFTRCPKKSGKTTFEALIIIAMTLLYGGAFPERYILANVLEQGRGRVFEICCRIVKACRLLKDEAVITVDKISFPAFNAVIHAIPSDAGTAAGTNSVCSGFDELWAYTSEQSSPAVG